MPSKSPAQRRFMAAVAHSPEFAKKVGVSQAVGREFNAADQARKHHAAGQRMAQHRMAKRGAR